MEAKDRKEEQVLQNTGVPSPDMVKEVKLWEAVSEVYDPELQMSIVTLGLVYGVEVHDDKAEIRMTLTSPGCPYGPELVAIVEMAARSVEGIKEVRVELVWEPPWGPDKMTEEARLDLGFPV